MGEALFLNGFSLPAINDTKMEETIELRDATTVTGRIQKIEADTIKIKTGSVTRTVSIADVKDVRSPRCFRFSMPLSQAKSESSTQLIGDGGTISFQSSYVAPPVGLSTLLPTTAMLEGQLSQNHLAKKLIVYSIGAAALSACFAVPIVLAIVTPHQLSDIKAAVKTVKANKKTGLLK